MNAALDGARKQKVGAERMLRALYWFGWGAAWT